jgi:hypothetical protein
VKVKSIVDRARAAQPSTNTIVKLASIEAEGSGTIVAAIPPAPSDMPKWFRHTV